MILRVTPGGQILATYTETLDLHALGRPEITRASHVEPTPDAHWTADLAPLGGPVLGPFARRSEALRAEIDWLESWLAR